jgi:hypothetical protein
MSSIELSNFYNWCDRRCEQCPLHESCPVFNAPDRSLEESLGEALAMATQMLRDEGMTDEEIDNLPPPPAHPPFERALDDAGMRWSEAYHLAGGPEILVVLVASKVARIASEEAMDDERLRAQDIAPNLLVVEQLLDEARTALDARQPPPPAAMRARFDEADRALRGFLAPLFAAIPAATRAAIAALAAAGRAPSPFSKST